MARRATFLCLVRGLAICDIAWLRKQSSSAQSPRSKHCGRPNPRRRAWHSWQFCMPRAPPLELQISSSVFGAISLAEFHFQAAATSKGLSTSKLTTNTMQATENKHPDPQHLPPNNSRDPLLQKLINPKGWLFEGLKTTRTA